MVKAGCSRCARDSSTTSAPANPCLGHIFQIMMALKASFWLSLRRPFQGIAGAEPFHQADAVGWLGHFKNYLWHDVVVNILFIRTCLYWLPSIQWISHWRAKLLLLHRHVLSTSRFPWEFWWFCGALAIGNLTWLSSKWSNSLPIFSKCSLINLLPDELNYNDKQVLNEPDRFISEPDWAADPARKLEPGHAVV